MEPAHDDAGDVGSGWAVLDIIWRSRRDAVRPYVPEERATLGDVLSSANKQFATRVKHGGPDETDRAVE